jgi:hypothetical protein
MVVGLAEIAKSSTIRVRSTECLRQPGDADTSDAATVIVQVVIKVFLVVIAWKEAPPDVWLGKSTIG